MTGGDNLPVRGLGAGRIPFGLGDTGEVELRIDQFRGQRERPLKPLDRLTVPADFMKVVTEGKLGVRVLGPVARHFLEQAYRPRGIPVGESGGCEQECVSGIGGIERARLLERANGFGVESLAKGRLALLIK